MARHGSTHTIDFIPPRSRYFDSGKFGRMFGKLPPFASDNPSVREALLELGKPGGLMDAQDPRDATAAELITNPAFSANNANNPRMTAGMTFLGQFIDHDMTFDPTSSLERQSDPEQIENFRVPTLALDNLYGAGPDANPHLYSRAHPAKFLIESSGRKDDLPRNGEGTALIGDPRNDENMIVSQLHLGFLKFHNAIVDTLAGRLHGAELFCEAQRLTRWHYQWILLHEFLPLTCGEEVVREVLDKGRRYYQWKNAPYIPVEFSVSAYRFGHSQVRPSYRANFTGNNGQPFFAFIFGNPGNNPADPDDLRGGARAPRRYVGWPTFFNFGDASSRPNKKIDTRLSSALFALPPTVVSNPSLPYNPNSLAQRNLLRHLTFALPSGQRVAQAMKLPVTEMPELAPLNLQHATPLWYYILKEAEVVQNGERLGPVGARIVAEVFIGLMQGDRTSYLSQEPDWTPTLPTVDAADRGKRFGMVDLLTLADPDAADVTKN
jgi:hypothetical protein